MGKWIIPPKMCFVYLNTDIPVESKGWWILSGLSWPLILFSNYQNRTAHSPYEISWFTMVLFNQDDFPFFLTLFKIKNYKRTERRRTKISKYIKKNPFCNLGMRDLFLVYDLVYGFCLTVVRGFCKSQNISEDIWEVRIFSHWELFFLLW